MDTSGSYHGLELLSIIIIFWIFFFSSRRRHTRYIGDWSSDVCSSDLALAALEPAGEIENFGTLLVAHFLENNPQVWRVTVRIGEHLWSRIAVDGKPHPTARSEERRVGKEGTCRGRRYHEKKI